MAIKTENMTLYDEIKNFVLEAEKGFLFTVYSLPFYIPREKLGLVSMWLSKWHNEVLIDRTTSWTYFKPKKESERLWGIIIHEKDGSTYRYMNNTGFNSFDRAKKEVRLLKERESKLPESHKKRIKFNIKRIK